jgi:hypothetical protein
MAALCHDAYSQSKATLHVDALSRIYNPSKMLTYAVYKETICLIYLRKMVHLITISFMSSLN